MATENQSKSSHVIKTFVIGAFCVTLSACDMQIPNQTITSASATQTRPADPNPAQTTSALQQAIHTTKDPSVQAFLTALEDAFQSDPRVAGAAIRSQGILAQANAAGQFFRPDISVTAQSYNQGATLQASQPIFDFGKQKARVSSLKSEAETEAQRLSEEQEAVLREALGAVLEAGYAKAKIAVYRRQIADFTKARDTATRLSALGVVNAADVRLAEVEHQRAVIALTAAQNDASAAKRIWGKLSRGKQIPDGLDPKALRRVALVDTIRTAKSRALQHNLSMRGYSVQKNQLNAEVETLRRSNTPTINATAEAVIGGSSDEKNAGLSLSYPIYRRDPRDQLSRVHADISALASEETSAAIELIFEIEQLDTSTNSAQSLVVAQRKGLSLLSQRVTDLDRQLENGLASYTDVIKARSDMFEAELGILENTFAARRADAEILVLTGVLIP